MSDAPVVVVDHDPRWSRRFRSESARLAAVLTPWLDGTIEHVGSTAVPRLPAKPIVDMVAPVKDHAAARSAIPVLEAAGYCHWADDPHKRWRHWFLSPRPEQRRFHLYLMQRDEPEFGALVAFRDRLRTHRREAEAYGALKRRLADDHGRDREAYTVGKTAFMEEAFARMGRSLPHPRRPG